VVDFGPGLASTAELGGGDLPRSEPGGVHDGRFDFFVGDMATTVGGNVPRVVKI
jgi:hypothetical protein